MSTQQRAPIASARASPSVTVRRLAARLAGSVSSRFTHRPTSEMTTSCAAKVRSMSRIFGSSFRSTAGQYAARYPSLRWARASSSGSPAVLNDGPPRRIARACDPRTAAGEDSPARTAAAEAPAAW